MDIKSKNQNLARKKKRKWNGIKPSEHRNLQQPQQENDIPEISCASSRKLDTSVSHESYDFGDYFIPINFLLLKELISHTGCQDCLLGKLTIIDLIDSRMGFCHLLELKCSNSKCDFSKTFRTSSKSKCDLPTATVVAAATAKKQPSVVSTPYEINVRALIGFREIGAGHESMQSFSSCMNMYCLSHNGYNKINKTVLLAYKDAAEKSMLRAAAEAKRLNDCITELKQIRVSIDGSWQKRGHNSRNGIVTAVCGDKCVDVEVLTKHCNGYKMWRSKKGTPQYQCWLVDHQCEINHETSSGSMESVEAVNMFRRSIEKKDCVYKEYLGDGDASSFNDVKNADPYKAHDIVPIKLECVGHVQKRLGTRLRNLVKAHKGTKTPLSGRGKLTEKCINSMQNFYGLAIRSNVDNLYAMKKAVYALLFHFTDIPNQI